MKLLRLKQEGRDIRDFNNEIQELSRPVKGVGERNERGILWDGADSYIREDWIQADRTGSEIQ